ncbi:MAG: hypothetical protein QOJ93_210 [Actinomycetota bacterium]|jgi:hypothetical protein|nr:hypothetical protein [Actinomycetota bacterium]
MAGCLAADSIASHRAAGTLWRLPEVELIAQMARILAAAEARRAS